MRLFGSGIFSAEMAFFQGPVGIFLAWGPATLISRARTAKLTTRPRATVLRLRHFSMADGRNATNATGVTLTWPQPG